VTSMAAAAMLSNVAMQRMDAEPPPAAVQRPSVAQHCWRRWWWSGRAELVK
jgi:hypothetical protein